ncbi:MAG: insulinase family protein [Gemmatimonadota bacterium]
MKLPLLLAAMAGVPSLCVAQYPTSPPAAAPVGPAKFPPFQQAVLTNGMRLVVVENHAQPVLSISLTLPAGAAYDPTGKEGLANMAAQLLTKGAGDRSAEQISAAIEGVGGSLNAGAGNDFLTISADVLSPQAELAFDLLADVAVRPTFPDRELELIKTQTLSALQLEMAQPDAVASRFFARYVYGTHPYARRPTQASTQAISREDILAFQRRRLRPGGSLLVMAGDITLARARALANKSFRGWTGRAPAATVFPVPPKRTSAEIILVHRPGSAQSNIVVGNTTFGPANPQYYAARVANQILGGGADSRLFLVLREQKGWTYGAYSGLERPRGVGTFQATAEVRTEVTDSALTELLRQMTNLGYTPLPDSELAGAKGALVGSFPLTIETANQVAGAVAQSILLGLPPDYLQNYRTRLAAVTAADVRTAARTAMPPRTPLIVVVGDGSRIYEKLTAIAPVRILSLEGAPIEPASLAVKASALDLDLSQVVPTRDSFVVMVQGNPLGFQRTEIRKVEGGFEFKEETQIASFMQQSTTVRLTENATVTSVEQAGKSQGRDTRINITYADGRVKGDAVVPGRPEFTHLVIDTTVVAGTLDDNSVQAILPALRWTRDAAWTMLVFSAGQNATQTMTMSVKGVETVQVPAGSFEVYRAEMTGGPAVINFMVTTALPHRLVKVSLVGVPLEFQLAR